MILEHYASARFDFDHNLVYLQAQPSFHRKPIGLWVSVKGEDDWPWWCGENEFYPDGLAYVYEVRLCPQANIHHISTAEGLLDFHQRYAVQTDYERRMEEMYPGSRYGLTEEFLRHQWPIDWREVVQSYDGLIIAPYLWSQRLGGPHWYYGWDCASGCIWTPAVIAIKEIENGSRSLEPRVGSAHEPL